jgi:hypothetical protein
MCVVYYQCVSGCLYVWQASRRARRQEIVLTFGYEKKVGVVVKLRLVVEVRL